MSKGWVSERNTRFHEGKEDVHDTSWSCQLTIVKTDENVEKVWQLVCADQRMTIRMIAAELEMDTEKCLSNFNHQQWNENGLCYEGVKNLTDDQWLREEQVCNNLSDKTSSIRLHIFNKQVAVSSEFVPKDKMSILPQSSKAWWKEVEKVTCGHITL